MNDKYQDFFASFEKEGEPQVRIRLAAGTLGDRGDLFGAAQEWLRLKDEERNERRASKAEIIARRANIIAISAIILSGITAISAASDKVILFLRWFDILKP